MPAQEGLTAVERDKLEIDPNFDFRELAKVDYGDIAPNVMAMFKWCGVYSQLQRGFFMIRVVTPGGVMTTRQFGRALDLSETYGQGELCITTRQTLQFHWVRLPDIYKVLEGMLEVGITTKNGCGDVTRNVVSCSMAGVCPNEIGDKTRSLVLDLATDPEIRDVQRNLPRKHKISIAGCNRACAQTLMNCQGWVSAEREVDGKMESGWIFHAGGGLGARPYLAKRVFDWVPDDLARDVARATVEAFRVHGNRRSRAQARLKVVVDKIGTRAFGELLLGIMKERGVGGLERIEFAADPAPEVGDMFLDGQAIVVQKQPGLSAVRIRIPRSEIRVPMGRTICRLADEYGDGEVAFTNRQNVEIRNVPSEKAEELVATLHEAGLQTEGHERLPDMVACVGTTQCKMAVSDTPKAFHRLDASWAEDAEYWKKVGPLRLHLTGCPNNCAQAWIADIGLRGRKTRQPDGTSREGFSIFVGGKLNGAGNIGRHLCDVDAPYVVPTLRALLDCYLAERSDASERFADYCERVPLAHLQKKLAAIAT